MGGWPGTTVSRVLKPLPSASMIVIERPTMANWEPSSMRQAAGL
jgi:hypothetical protein